MLNTRYLQSNKDIKIKYHKIVVLLLFIITSLPIIDGTSINIALAIISSVSILILLFTSKIEINGYVIWWILVGFFIFLSTTWSLNFELAIAKNKQFILVGAFYIYISFLIKSENDFYTIIKIFVISKLIMAIYVIAVVDFSTLGNIRIGADNLGEEWNSNTIGMNLAFASFAIMVLLKKEKKVNVKILYYTSLILCSTAIFLTGSKKAFFILLFCFGLYTAFNAKQGKLKNIIITIVISSISIYLIMNVPIFYNVLGFRIESLFAIFTGEGYGDSSSTTRMAMIEKGFELFKQRPITGYGVNNFLEVYGNLTGDYRYSHNNYIELLVGIGIFGTVVYYFGLLYIVWKTLTNKSELAVVAFISIFTILIIDLGLVSYLQYYIHFFICLSFSAIHLTNNQVKDIQ